MGPYRKYCITMRAYLSRGAFNAGPMGTLAKAVTMLLPCLLLLQAPMRVSAQTMPIIDLHGENEASAIWAMQDYVQVGDRTFKGYGHYHERYRRENGVWKISSWKLTRLRVDTL